MAARRGNLQRIGRPLTSITAVFCILIAIVHQLVFSPTAAFQRHFGNQPNSVSKITRAGYAGLAGADETLTFRIEPRDLDELILSKRFSPIAPSTATRQSGTLPDADMWSRYRAEAASMKIEPSHHYVHYHPQHGSTHYVLITDASRTRVYYHYFKL